LRPAGGFGRDADRLRRARPTRGRSRGWHARRGAPQRAVRRREPPIRKLPRAHGGGRVLANAKADVTEVAEHSAAFPNFGGLAIPAAAGVKPGLYGAGCASSNPFDRKLPPPWSDVRY